jgi:hypothetical protein
VLAPPDREGHARPSVLDRGQGNWPLCFILIKEAYGFAEPSPELRLSYWRTAAGTEVDFVLGDAEVGIKVKSIAHADVTHLRGLRAKIGDHGLR